MTKRTAMLILICGLLFASACQPTPEGSTMELRERDSFDFSEDEPAESAAGAEPLPSASAPYVAPDLEYRPREFELTPAAEGQYDPPRIRSAERVSRTYANEGLHVPVAFSADVTVPENEALSVVKLKPVSFDAAFFEGVARLFANGGDLVYLPALTRSQYNDMIIEATAVQIGDGTRGEASRAEYIAYLESMMAAAPETADVRDFDFRVDGSGAARGLGQSFSCAFRSPVGGGYATLSGVFGSSKLCYSAFGDDVAYQTDEMVMSGDALPNEPRGTRVTVDSVSEAEARAVAETLLNTLGIGNVAVASITAGRCVDVNSRAVITSGWWFTYSCCVEGIMCESSARDFSIMPSCYPVMGAPWEATRVDVIVNERGILYLNVNSLVEKDGAPLGEIELLDMDTLLQCISDQFCYLFASQANPGWEYAVTVHEMRLSHAVLSVPNELRSGQLVPVWYVRFAASQGGLDYGEREIAFAAHNGSYVEPRMLTVELNSLLD